MKAPKRVGRGIFAPLVVQALTLAWVAVWTGCSPAPGPKPPVHESGADGGYPIVHTDSSDDEDPAPGAGTFPACSMACKVMKDHACGEAVQLKGGKTCYALCRDEEIRGKFSLKPACVAKATSLLEIRRCGTVQCEDGK